MRFFSALVVYVAMGAVIAWGITQTFKGNFWLLGVAFLAYLVALVKIGCLPSSDEHH